MARADRESLIEKIEAARNSRVLTYICGDRQGGAASQIGDDAVRPMYDHLLRFGETERVDLLVYSRGGDVDVPWRVVCMLREFCSSLGVLVPYRAHSAATMIALGADEIVLGRKGELGPIDPAMTIAVGSPDGSRTKSELRVEDIIGYVEFLKERFGLTDPGALAGASQQLTNQLGSPQVGQVYRVHSHIRSVARKLLSLRETPPTGAEIDTIIMSLAERIYAHGHAIGRVEATEIGLPVTAPDPELEGLIWELFLDYEDALQLRTPLDPHAELGGTDKASIPVRQAAIESVGLCHAFGGELEITAVRAMPEQLNIPVHVNLQLPKGITVDRVPQNAQAVIQQAVNEAQKAAQAAAPAAIRSQSPIRDLSLRVRDARWRELDPGEELV